MHPLLAKFSIEAASIILQTGKLLHVETGQTIYQKQDLELKVYMIIYGSFQISTESPPSPEPPAAQKDIDLAQDTASVDDRKQTSPKNVAILDQTNLNDFTLNRA